MIILLSLPKVLVCIYLLIDCCNAGCTTCFNTWFRKKPFLMYGSSFENRKEETRILISLDESFHRSEILERFLVERSDSQTHSMQPCECFTPVKWWNMSLPYWKRYLKNLHIYKVNEILLKCVQVDRFCWELREARTIKPNIPSLCSSLA